MVVLGFILGVTLVSSAEAMKGEYDKVGISNDLQEIVKGNDLEGWLVFALISLLGVCCFGKCMSCCLGFCFDHREYRQRPLLGHYAEIPRAELLPSGSEHSQYVPPPVTLVNEGKFASKYPYLPKAEATSR